MNEKLQKLLLLKENNLKILNDLLISNANIYYIKHAKDIIDSINSDIKKHNNTIKSNTNSRNILNSPYVNSLTKVKKYEENRYNNRYKPKMKEMTSLLPIHSIDQSFLINPIKNVLIKTDITEKKDEKETIETETNGIEEFTERDGIDYYSGEY